jgi:septal ring factor EnvC (AmiA/AmiB activator)
MSFEVRNPSSRIAVIGMVLAAGFLSPTGAAGQRRNIDQQIREDRARLQEIREQRQSLESELRTLRAGARNVNSEIQNLDRQRTATTHVVNELERQLSGLGNQLDTITFELILAEDAISEKQAVLERRVIEIYKRGTLWAFQVLLAAESFGDLLSRYKYLYLVSRQDRSMITDVEDLRDRVSRQRRDMVNVRSLVQTQRTERDRELREFSQLEQQRQRILASLRRDQRRAQSQIDTLSADEQRLNRAIDALEVARRAAIASGTATAVALISDNDLGRLEWPIDSREITYSYGRQTFQGQTVIFRNGIGIEAPVGTEVRTVRGGTVAILGAYGTYEFQVMVDHGGGFYTIYQYLSRATVFQGQNLGEGDVIGLSGGENSEEGPHIEFQIRRSPPNATSPVAMDPRNWLKAR